MSEPEPFRWPPKETLQDVAAFNLWLAMTLQGMSYSIHDVASLQRAANGRTSKIEGRISTLDQQIDLISKEHGRTSDRVGFFVKVSMMVLAALIVSMVTILVTFTVKGGWVVR